MKHVGEVQLELFKDLLKRLEAEHDGYLKAIDDQSPSKTAKHQYSQVEAMHVNVMRLRGLIMWLEQGEKIK